MKLIELVLLMGAHCVSPVQHMASMTEAGKVQCAVVVEKDTETGAFRITPKTAATDERVLAAVQKLSGETSDNGLPTGPTIVPAAARPGGGATAEEAVPAPPEPQPEATAPPELPPPKPREKHQCRGSATPRWYTAANGHRKYRCVK